MLCRDQPDLLSDRPIAMTATWSEDHPVAVVDDLPGVGAVLVRLRPAAAVGVVVAVLVQVEAQAEVAVAGGHASLRTVVPGDGEHPLCGAAQL